MTLRSLPLTLIAALAILAAACGSDEPAAQPTAANTPTVAVPTPNPWTIPGIVDPTNFGWPRELTLGGETITVDAPPQRIHTLSLGHDEIIVALVGADRLAGIGSFTANETYSNVAAAVADLPQVSRDPEEVVSLNPDIVIASKFTKQDLVDSIAGTGIQVVRTELESSAEGHETNIRILAYMLGAEEAAEALIADIQARIDRIEDAVGAVPTGERPTVLSIARFSDSISAAGADSTEGGIIEQAGGRNAAAMAGLEGHNTVSIESIVAMSPDAIVITQPDPGASELRDELLAEPALAGVPAIANQDVFFGDPRYFTTLSHWNVRGIEELAALIYPDRFQGAEFTDFE